MTFNHFKVPYATENAYTKKVAYFSMEFAVHQPLKIYSGGLGFLAGSHMRSAYELKQNLIGVGILWKYGYYDQARNQDQTLQVQWNEKIYNFLEDTGIKFQINIHEHPVWVKVWYLNPETFKSAPMFLLSTDLPENDYVSQTICHRLYDANVATKVAQFILLGVGGAKLIDELGFKPDVYHLNEAHAISAAFYLYNKFGNAEEVKKRLVFTTHTPEEAGNEKHDIYLCEKMSYFCGIPLDEVRKLTGIYDDQFNHSLAALRFARHSNGVSALHGEVSRKMWSHYENIAPITHVTNAQNWRYWADKQLYFSMDEGNEERFDDRKTYLKRRAFDLVADQTGKLFKDEVRRLGTTLGLPFEMLYRHPFPGPGLGVRILGEVKKEYADILRLADDIFMQELRASGWYDKTAQAFAVFQPVKSVGVVGDGRRYAWVIALRAVETVDFMTARFAHLPYDLVDKISTRIMNEIKDVSRVVYDVSSKPPATIEWE